MKDINSLESRLNRVSSSLRSDLTHITELYGKIDSKNNVQKSWGSAMRV